MTPEKSEGYRKHINKIWILAILLISLVIWFLTANDTKSSFQFLALLLLLIAFWWASIAFFNPNNEPKKSKNDLPSYYAEKLFELGTRIKALGMILPLATTLIGLLGFLGYKDILKDIDEKIKSEPLLAKLEEAGKDIELKKAQMDTLQGRYAARVLEMDNYRNRLLPVGSIIAFNGEQNNIPDDWVICDGRFISLDDGSTFMTPNLVDRFIMGTNENYLHPSGGAASHSHRFSISIPNISTERNVPDTIAAYGAAYIEPTHFDNGAGYRVNHTHSLRLAADEYTSVSDNLPPYYKLIYILKYR